MYNRGLCPSRKQAIPLLMADAIIGNKAFSNASYNILSQRPKLQIYVESSGKGLGHLL